MPTYLQLGDCRRSAAALSILGLALLLVACGREGSDAAARLPGRSRPLLQHDWPHPREMKFAPSAFKPPLAERALVTTGAGLRAFVISDDAAPLVRITAALPLGRLYERPREAGAAAVLRGMLTRDGPTGSTPLSERLEELGTRLEAEDDLDLTQLTIDVLPQDWQTGVALMVDLVRRPTLDPSLISSYRAGPGYIPVTSGVAGHGFRPKVELERLAAGYPIAPVGQGTQVSLEAVRALAVRTLRPDAIALGIGGNVPRGDVEAHLESVTAGWQPLAEDKPELVAWTPAAGGQWSIQTIDDASLQGWIAIGHAVGPVAHEDRAALAVMAEILNIRLNIAAREIRGLANKTTFEGPGTRNGIGMLLIRSGGRTEAVAPLVKHSMDEVRRLATRGDTISVDEMEQAKGILADGEWQGVLEGAIVAAGTYAAEVVRHGSLDRLLNWPVAVRGVTEGQVKAVAAKYLRPDAMTAVVIGPMDKIRNARHPRWPVSLDDLSGPTRLAEAGQP